MHPNGKQLFLEKDDLKEAYKCPLEHLDYMDVLAQVLKYVAKYFAPF